MKYLEMTVNALVTITILLVFTDIVFMGGLRTISLLESARHTGLVMTFPLAVAGVLLYNLWSNEEKEE